MKTVFISGGDGDLGCALSKKFLHHGYHVLAHYLDSPQKLLTIAAKLHKQDFLHLYQANFCHHDDLVLLVKKVKNDFKHIDVLINNAGKTSYKLIQDFNEKDVDDLYKINFKALWFLTKEFKSLLSVNKKSNILNIASVLGITGSAQESIYSALKAAIINFTKSAALEYVSYGIKVNCVAPGAIKTQMLDQLAITDLKELKQQIPLKRFATCKEIADIIYLLITKQTYCTGSTIIIDGGLSLV